MIARRHVLHVAGYDPVDARRHHRRFTRELATYAATWNVAASVSEPVETAHGVAWKVITKAPNWSVETTYELLEWRDIVLRDLAQPAERRLRDAAVAFADFIGSGTVARYVSASHRYALFFMVPLLQLALFAIVSLVFGHVVSGAVALTGIGRLITTILLAVPLFVLLLHWPGKRWRLDQALHDWIFAREYMYGRRADIERRLDDFAARLVAVLRAREADEVLLVGHSLGALLAIDLIDRAAKLDPAVGRDGARLSFLTVGATIPKLTLHPAGERFRACARRVATMPAVDWVEYQSRDDAISFYKFHPVKACRVADNDATAKPLVRRVQIHEMLSPRTFRRKRFRFMRMHYQFVMANERRAPYDYFMLVCGPISLLPTAYAPTGPVDLFGPDGSVLAEKEAAR
jgi:pimeloyl-ACP methyl ester carboxylesterase